MPPKTRTAVRKPRRKDRKNVTHGNAYIKSTFNNTIVSLTDPTGAVVPAWKVFWTIFGTANQLLAGLTLLGLTVWLKKRGGRAWIATAVPMGFMMAMTLWSLANTVWPWLRDLGVRPRWDTVPVVALVLTALALLLIVESIQHLRRERTSP